MFRYYGNIRLLIYGSGASKNLKGAKHETVPAKTDPHVVYSTKVYGQFPHVLFKWEQYRFDKPL